MQYSEFPLKAQAFEKSCSSEERELIDEIAFSIFLDEPRIFGVKALQSSLYIPNIGFTLCYNDGCVVSEKVFIKNKCLILSLTTVEMKSVMLNFLWIKNVVVMIQLVNKGKTPFQLPNCSWHSINKVFTCRIELMSHRSCFAHIGVINIKFFVYNQARNLLT